MRLLAVLGLVSACGSSPSRHIGDAPAVVHDTAATPADAQCTTFVASTTTATDTVMFTLDGGAFQSFGCAPIDPNYWMSGSGMSATVAFVAPQSHPSIRVWGMNTDDTASLTVNGTAYALDATSASLSPKVVCGVSPGPDGMAFTSGILTGANTPGEGNYSYQDLTIEQTGVTSIQISSLTGAGWGFAGVSVAGCVVNPN
jgi:hypothetical protein